MVGIVVVATLLEHDIFPGISYIFPLLMQLQKDFSKEWLLILALLKDISIQWSLQSFLRVLWVRRIDLLSNLGVTILSAELLQKWCCKKEKVIDSPLNYTVIFVDFLFTLFWQSFSLFLGSEKCSYQHCYIGSTFTPKLQGKFLATENFFHTSQVLSSPCFIFISLWIINLLNNFVLMFIWVK